jgi:hypothetical protein
MRSAYCAIWIAIAATTAACSGGNSGGNEATVGYSGSELSDYAAAWDGYAEAWQFPSGSDRVRVTLDANGQGTIEFGDQPLLPPPTDSDVGYPPGTGVDSNVSGVFEGVRYPIYDTRLEAHRIRLAANPNDLFKIWCQMQTPVLHDNGTYGCLPNWGGGQRDWGCFLEDPQTSQQVPVDCGKILLCSMYEVCQCSAAGCDAIVDLRIQIDAVLEDGGNSLDGTLAIDGTRLTVRLTRG